VLMGVPEYAAHRGVDIKAVRWALKAGRIHADQDNRIDSETADADWAKNTDPAQSRPGRRKKASAETPVEPVPGMSFADARALNEVYDAKRRRLELGLREEQLVERAEVERESYRLWRILRDAFQNLPERLSARLATMTERSEIHQVLEDAIREVLMGFSDGKLQ
jgi:hypothetical protein